MKTVAAPKAPNVRCARPVVKTPAALPKQAIACGLALCLSVGAVDMAQAATPGQKGDLAPSAVSGPQYDIQGEGPGLGSFVTEDVEGALKPPGKKTVEKAQSKGAEAVANVVGASGVKTFQPGSETEKPSINLDETQGNTGGFIEELTAKISDAFSK